MTTEYPAHVFLELHMECNLKCLQCDIHTLRNPVDELSEGERLDVVRQVAAWHSGIRVVSAGGEPFLRRRLLYAVAAEARRLGVYFTVSTNGTLLRPVDVEQLPHSGVRCIVVSLDSDEADVHDSIRGVPRTFERATNSVRDLAGARDRANEDFTVLTSTILGAHNLHRVPILLDYLERLGADTSLFQPLQPPFARVAAPNWHLTDPLFPRDHEVIDRGMDALVAARRAQRRVFQTEEQLEDIRRYLHEPRSVAAGQCTSMERHLMVDMAGYVRLCFNMERIGLHPVGHVRSARLRDLWGDLDVERTRERMRPCREACGSMVCHAR